MPDFSTPEWDAYRGEGGGIRSDLLGGKYGADNLTLDVAKQRQSLRDNKYHGEWGGGGASQYAQSYSDHDNNVSTPWAASNDSNIDRFGKDVGEQREAIRNKGFEGLWGLGDADSHVKSMYGDWGFTPFGKEPLSMENLGNFDGYKGVMQNLNAMFSMPQFQPYGAFQGQQGQQSAGPQNTDYAGGVGSSLAACLSA